MATIGCHNIVVMLNQVHHNFRIIDLSTLYHYFTMVDAVRIHSTVILLHWLACAKSTTKQWAVHCRQAFWHLQCPLLPFLQLQSMSSLQACVASGRVVQHITQPPSAFFFQPRSSKMEVLELQLSSGPSSDQFGRQPSWCAGWVQPV